MITKMHKAIERHMVERNSNVIPMGPEGVTQAEIDDLQRMVPEGQERAPEAPVRVKVRQNLDDDVAGLEQYRSELEQWREQVQRELQDAEDKISEAPAAPGPRVQCGWQEYSCGFQHGRAHPYRGRPGRPDCYLHG